MATKIVMEALSPTMEEGRLVAWKKKEGDAVKSGETLAEVETDKAVMELVARGDGVLRKIVLGEGATVPVGALVAIVGTSDEDISGIAGGAAAPAPKKVPGGMGVGGSGLGVGEDEFRSSSSHAWITGLPATIEPWRMTSCAASSPVTSPPASRTISVPAATSHGASFSSQKPSNWPVAT